MVTLFGPRIILHYPWHTLCNTMSIINYIEYYYEIKMWNMDINKKYVQVLM